MQKRLFVILLTVVMLLGLLPLNTLAANTEIHIKDTSSQYSCYSQLNTVYSVETGKAVSFSYSPTDTTVLIFFSASGCSRSKTLFAELGETAWTKRNDIHIVAVESSAASRSDVQQFLKETNTENLVTAYYNDQSNSLPFWYKKLLECDGDMNGVTSIGGSISFAYVLLIQPEQDGAYIRYELPGTSRAQVLTNYLANLVDLDNVAVDTVNVTLPGTYHYENVQSVFDLVNAHRNSQGLTPLTLSKSLTELAMQRAAECAVSFSHTRPNGESCFNVTLDGVTYNGYMTAENIATGQSTPESVMSSWINSPGHNANILRTGQNQIGIGCFENFDTLYWVQLFGSGQDQSTSSKTAKQVDVTVSALEDQIHAYVSSSNLITAPVNSRVELPTLYHLADDVTRVRLRPIVSTTIGTATVESGTGNAILKSSKAGNGTVYLRAYDSMQPYPLNVRFTTAQSNTGTETKPDPGVQKLGWNQIGPRWYYYQNNKPVTDWMKIDGIWYYFDRSGVMATEWQKIDGIWYYFEGSGDMVTDWKQIDGTWYYLQGSGAMQTEWLNLNGTWYYMEDSGAMVTGWKQVGGTWYYFSDSGAMQSDWLNLSGTWYYLETSGAMVVDWKQIDGTWYYFNSFGSMATGWLNLNGTWYYLYDSGAMATGWLNLDSTWYYFNSNGSMVSGTQNIDGVTYTFNSSGVWVS